MKTISNIHILLLLLTFAFALSAEKGWANTAANTQIINQAQLTYNDGAGLKTVNATPVVVTVSLIPGVPTVTKGADQTTPYAGSDTQLTNTFTITASNTNGPDNYSLTSAINAMGNASGASVAVTSPASPVRLGATLTLVGTTASVLVVPSDGVSDAAVNGIAQNAWVVVNGEAKQVASIVDNAAGTSTITLASALATAPGAGVLVAEQKTVTVTLKSGTITTAGQNIVITKHLTIASTTDPTKTATSADITDTYVSGLATLTKYVRNVTSSTAGTGTKYTYPVGTDYYQAGITARPGETLEYILVATNTGTGSVTSSAITDTLPTTYVSLKTGVYSGGRDITYFNESGTPSYLTSAAADDAATYAAPSLTVNVGTGATSAAGGTIATGATVRVLYQVTVNP